MCRQRFFFFKQKTAYEITVCLEFRRVLFRSQAEDGIRDHCVTGVQTCALPISPITLLRNVPKPTVEAILRAIPVFSAFSRKEPRGNCELPSCPPTNVVMPCRTCDRSEEHTSELQSHSDLVCRLLLEKTQRNKST